jgi:2-polyprenyl-3-methyl-5-hydroxy-6-metoxy-1,4-benzoquinol methylase
MSTTLKSHWDTVYETKQPNQVSWTQDIPQTSLDFISSFNLPNSASIIDIGGGDSKLVDFLLDMGYTNITVLDISEKSIERAKIRLGVKSSLVNWIVRDIVEFEHEEIYDLWHDRAAFHFLTNEQDITHYLHKVSTHAKNIIIATFSVDGPVKCSGLKVQQYDELSMKDKFEKVGFSKIECKRVDHTTPMGTVQNFVFCAFHFQ